MNSFHDILSFYIPTDLHIPFLQWALGDDVFERPFDRDESLAEKWNELHGQLYRIKGDKFYKNDLMEAIRLFWDIHERKLKNIEEGNLLDIECHNDF